MKIPDQAHRVFKGTIFDVYQWDQELYDGSHGVFEMLKRADTLQILATEGDKILVTYESQPNKEGFYSFPGGKAEDAEDPLSCAKREMLEETGMESDDWKLYRVYEPFHKIDWKIYYYIARNCRTVRPPQLDAGERIEVKRLSFDEFIQFIIDGHYGDGAFVTDILRMKLNDPDLTEFRKMLF